MFRLLSLKLGYRLVILILRRLQFVFGYDPGRDLSRGMDLDKEERVVLSLVNLMSVVEEHAQAVVQSDIDGVLVHRFLS